MQSGNASSAGHAWSKQTRKMQNGCVNNLDELPAPESVYLFSLCIIKKYLHKNKDQRSIMRAKEERKMCHFPTAK